MLETQHLPKITEIKHRLDKPSQTFACRSVRHGTGAAVVLFVSDRPMPVANLVLPTGTITFGYFWEGRGYNVYHWMNPEGQTLGHYFNICDQTTIRAGRLDFRDLVVDVLFRPRQAPQILDADELPSDVDAVLRAYIDARCAEVLNDGPRIVEDIERLSQRYWSELMKSRQEP